MQRKDKLRSLTNWPYPITCSILQFCGILFLFSSEDYTLRCNQSKVLLFLTNHNTVLTPQDEEYD